ncbi:MAG: hypothetical protein F2667_12595, partial [Actinobacteria bacterium]|nr:hypothetical protein [Actinomycetota bacterium]
MNAARAIRLDIETTTYTRPTWDRVDDATAGLLAFVSFGPSEQWDAFLGAVRA